jgi:hypothetical protein
VSYTQHNEQTYDLAVPGDFTSATFTITGGNIYRSSTGKHVLLAGGRQVCNFDQSQLIQATARTPSSLPSSRAINTPSTRYAPHSARLNPSVASKLDLHCAKGYHQRSHRAA